MGGDFSEDGASLGEDNFEEVSIRESAVNTRRVLSEDVSNILFDGDEVVFSEEVNDLVNSEGSGSKTSETLERSVRFKSRTFSKDLSGDFNVLFAVGEGLKVVGNFVFSGETDHVCV